MKKNILFIVILLSLLSSCSKNNSINDINADLLNQIKNKNKLVVAMEGTWAPWTYHDENDKLVGFDTEVATLVAQKIGVDVQFIEGEWDSLFTGLDSGRYDIVVNGVEETEDRKEKYDFSVPYAYIKTALIVRADNNNIKTFDDLNGKITANSINSTYMNLAEKYGAEVKGVDSLDETIDMVLSKRADATLNAEVSFLDYMNVHPEANLKIVSLTDEASNVSIPIRKGVQNSCFKNEIDKAIIELRNEGKLTELSNKYFGKDITN